MAGNKRTIYLGLDYTQFTGGVAEVNRKMGLLDAEFKLASQQAKNYGKETDQLGLKTDYLAQKIQLQNQKVEAAKKAFDEASATQNKSQKEIDALQKKLIQEQTALEKLTGDFKQADAAEQGLDKTTKSFGDEIRGMASALGLQVSPAIEKLAEKFDGINANVGNAILGIGAIASAFIKCTVDAAGFADELLTLSAETSISTDQLQKLQYAAKFVDVDVSTMSSSMSKLTQQMVKAKSGSGEAADAFRRLRISVRDGNGQLKDSEEMFYQVIDKLGKISNETERDALAMQIFGKSARELNPLIEAGSQRLKELGAEAEQLGVVMSEGDIQALGKLQDAMDRFESTTEALKNSLGLTLLPLLTGLFEALSKIPVPVLQTLVILGTTIASILLVVKAIKSLTDTGKAIKNFFTTFDFAANKTTLIIIGIVVALIALATIIAVIAGKSSELNRSMQTIGDAAGQLSNSVTGAQNQVKKTQTNAMGVAEFAGGQTWVGEAGPELVTLPRGSRIDPEGSAGTTEYNTFYVTIDAKNVDDFNRVVELAKAQRMAERRLAY